MVRTCMAFGCRGNYPHEPYTKLVSSWNEESKQSWIAAMPNDPKDLASRQKICLCVTHFEGEWRSIQGGRKPVNPPSIFLGEENSGGGGANAFMGGQPNFSGYEGISPTPTTVENPV